ncbi:39S ribosomal protein L14, mitochondrial [Trichoplax sp. H2]|nr:39S ribosomal protein L14, mitochondrial [Trichoplax sp. H2]|eukprot:RDD46593.1 39S ribosomal protein L14, mitochondrial [Trichoplax sp. H2]
MMNNLTRINLSSHLPLSVSNWFNSISCRSVQLLTRLRYVDNCENAGKTTKYDRPYCIKLYKNRKVAKCGDIIMIAHRGKTYKALLVSNRLPSKTLPRHDTNNIVLLNDKLEPVGTRIKGPIPTALFRRGKFSKVLAIASKFL